ncbi:PucR family transcriptional regulator [Streptomyces genisteinicus]|uniref:Helix-turn-helix domain-containing protein n=1 Tax=Streptomyces genisteinicus TaxID=2768068 RepID=A0A7H0HVD9_9ACTN|nr:helix-turn-helix domain-containing protein [Streptomyces genisteinicus]QNP64505.1 helix-turn-helix domain-containing protein [Streptomyces genisteinicus]
MNDTADGFGPPGTPAASAARLADLLGADAVRAGDDADAAVREVIIAEPGDAIVPAPGLLVLAVGARGPEAGEAVRAAGRAGAAAVAVRAGADGAVPRQAREAAEETGVVVLGIPAGLRWDQVEAEVRGVLEAPTRAVAADRRGDLFSLAQTVATLTCGVVSIEDSAHRVVAYAGPVDEADEVRMRSVLGRSCPESYLALLRQWGVYRRVRGGDEVVEVEERPDMGTRRRLVTGINAGARLLGTIWVQEGARPLAERSGETLRGAARLAASQLVDHYYQGDSAARVPSRADLAHGLLTGRFNSAALAAHLGIEASAEAAVVAIDLREAPGAGDAAWEDARRAEAAGIVSVHAAAYRRNALVTLACGQIYAMLPDPRGRAADETALVRWAGDVVGALRRHTGTPVQAVVAGTAGRLDEIPAVKLRGYHGLEVLARTPGRAVETHGRLTASLMLRGVLEALGERPEIRHPAVEALVAHDLEHGTEVARSLLLYLDAFGDVGPVAKELNVHPNTLRYRVRKAVALTGLDLDDPEHRLAATLQLRLSLGGGPARPAPPFPTG